MRGDKNMRTQGERIKKLRKSKGVTQRELAERLGISEQAVSKWEKNLSNPSTKNLLQIAKIFGVCTTSFENLFSNFSFYYLFGQKF